MQSMIKNLPNGDTNVWEVFDAPSLSSADHIKFFNEMLSDIDTPTLPFDLSNVHGDCIEFDEKVLKLSHDLNNQLRVHARNLNVTLSSLCHLAWGQVLAHASGCEAVVFGTVLFDRSQGGEENDSAMGLVINTLPLRLDIDETTIEDAVRRTHAQLSALLAHEHAPLELAQRCSGVPATLQLFSALLNFRHKDQNGKVELLFPGKSTLSSAERTNYPLTMTVDDDNTAISLTVQVMSSLSAARICAYMQQALVSLADALTHTPKQSVRKLTVLPAEEREMLLHTWNKTEVAFPRVRCLHQLFEAQVERDGQAIAVECEGKTLSYAELNAQANQLAHYLIAKGVKPDDRIALCVKRSTKMLIAILGILKAGGAYVPLDPVYSSQRLINILDDADPVYLLADATGQKALGYHRVSIVDLDIVLPDGLSTDNPDPTKLGLTPTHLAYVIYTSGSTGKPKGVMVEHLTVHNLAHNVKSLFGITSTSRILQFASCCFDTSLHEIIMAIMSGACLCIPCEEVRQTNLMSYIIAKNITHADLPPALLQNLQNPSVLKSLHTLILGGEAPALSVLQTTFSYTKVFNSYGQTETTITATNWLCPVDFKSHPIPIGRPMSNIRIYLLDLQGKPVPLGAEGELYIGGAGVARVYLNRPELTAERFLPDPFSENPEARMYRSGDRARYLPDGNLVYLGRTDQQVKIRGFRIEPGEIEGRLIEHPLVQDAVVLSWKNKPDTDARLVAYVVAEQDISLALNLRTYLVDLLPEYMVPAAYVCLPSLPLTPNGKLDRRALPAPDDESFARQSYEPPKGEMEVKLATLWSEILGIECISRHDNFFALGGHSLLIVRMLSQLRQAGLDTNVREVFDAPSLAALAKTLGHHKALIIPPNLITADSTKITPEMLPLITLPQTEIDALIAQVPGGVANVQDIYGLAPLQQGILFHHMMAEHGDPYLLITRLQFEDRTSLERYSTALQQVIERHDILRTAFMWEGLNEPAQVVLRHVPSLLTEVTLNDTDEPILEQLSKRFNPRHYRLDLKQAPLLRLIAASTSEGEWVALELMHHLTGDHESLERLYTEVEMIFMGQKERLATPIPFRNVVAQARLGVSSVEHTKFFNEMLSDIDTSTLPFGLRDVHGNGTKGG
ncbi:uncharacterized protein LOC116347764 [Contarinia nasturtii]|uniref:uncharacterized protein LOC116347764 n=1 Tax=Contarinia nasturtii TaxID=265458 RepID=UPI0012D45859|nr:uncharacterized protein LOC116347764 [Contarinia nasturtii]